MTQSAAGPAASVVVLEEQPILRQALVNGLLAAGFRVAAAYADPTAFAHGLSNDQAQVAVVGLNPHDGTGGLGPDLVGVLREVRQRHPELKLLVFSSATDEETVDRCYREGASGFVDKRQAQLEDLAQALLAVARGERIVPMHLIRSPFAPLPREPEPDALLAISLREREVLSFVAAGADNLKIAAMLKISERTVKAHVSALYRKLGSENRTQLALAALGMGIRPQADV